MCVRACACMSESVCMHAYVHVCVPACVHVCGYVQACVLDRRGSRVAASRALDSNSIDSHAADRLH